MIDLFEQCGIPLPSINKKFDDEVFQQARLLRKKQALSLKNYIESHTQELSSIQKGLLTSVLERNPFENTEKVLAFNHEITKRTCRAILEDESLDPIRMITLYSNTIELGAREFIDPVNVDNTFTHLSAAKETGFFFTPASIAIRMVLCSIKYGTTAKTVFDPACGAGIFLAFQMLLNSNIESVTGIELDTDTAEFARELLNHINKMISNNVGITIIQGNFFDFFENRIDMCRFDLIVMNPPYGNIKFLASDLTDISTKAVLADEEKAALGKRMRETTMEYAANLRVRLSAYGIGKGTLEFSKLFLAANHELLSSNGFIVSITPSSWLGDESSTEFRKNLIVNGYLYELWSFPEVAKLFKGVNQPTTVSIIGKQPTPVIRFSDGLLSVTEIEGKMELFSASSMLSVSGEKVRFPKCSADSLTLLEKLLDHGRFKDNAELINARGELDLTTHKRYVSFENTEHRLIRGDHISGWLLKKADESEKAGYVDFNAFCDAIGSSEKRKYISLPRIAIAQCSYLQKKKRIEAAVVSPNCVISNSCNFLVLTSATNSREKICYYWALINSTVLEWQFRIFSYNNHVGNKEIDELFCVPYANIPPYIKTMFCSLSKKTSLDGDDYLQMDAAISIVLGLCCEDYSQILQNVGITNSIQRLKIFKEIVQK